MGLKTTNLKIEELGIELPEAYAIVAPSSSIPITSGIVTFNIQTSRENAFFKKPIKQVKVYVQGLSRDESLLPQIYAQAKRKATVQKWDRETRQPYYEEVDSYFSPWEDDIYEPVEEATAPPIEEMFEDETIKAETENAENTEEVEEAEATEATQTVEANEETEEGGE